MNTPTGITLHQRSRTLEIAFEDGASFKLPFEFLRVYSPSAEVRGHGPGQEILQAGKIGVGVNNVTPVGSYAIKIEFNKEPWGDGCKSRCANATLFLDTNKPVWDKARFYVDLSAGYRFKLFGDKVRMKTQLNVKNALENGHLQTIGVNPDGRGYAYRIIDPRQFILSASFDL